MPLHGAIAAAVTPLKDGGLHLDEEGVDRVADFLAEGGVDGVLTCGTTGESVLLSVAERRRVTELFLARRTGGFQVAVHAGAQTTSDTVALAAHALEAAADAVAVIAPPYFPLDDEELFRHLVAAAGACDPLPFYVYAFAGRSGYPVPTSVVERLRNAAANLRGLKVSDTPFSAVEPYLALDGLDVFIGSEPLTLEGMRHGAVGAVSGLASAWPDLVASLVHDRSAEAHERVGELRERLRDIPFHAALKEVLVARGVILDASVRPPLRGLADGERSLVRSLMAEVA
jgi:dihydrodipicolinate synthase/N-acetylneuraminate lyase